jgi:hypothetical protein
MAIGIEIDQEAIQYAQHHSSSTRSQFLTADSMALPFPTTVDVMYETSRHVPDKTDEGETTVLKHKVLLFFMG